MQYYKGDNMKRSIVLQKDYTYIYDNDREENIAANDFCDAVFGSEEICRRLEERRSIPRMVNPDRAKIFEYMVKEADAFALDFGGKIEAFIDYDHYKAEVRLYLPFFDITQKRERYFFMKVIALADSVSVTPAAEEATINLTLTFDYFVALDGDTSGLNRAEAMNTFMKELADVLGDYNEDN